MTQPELLTEAEARELLTRPDSEAEAWIATLRERGLIAPAPEKTPKDHAWQVCVDHGYCHPHSREHHLATAALRRGMELAKPELTREQFIDLSAEAHTANGNAWGMQYESFLWDGLHAALQGQSK